MDVIDYMEMVYKIAFIILFLRNIPERENSEWTVRFVAELVLEVRTPEIIVKELRNWSC